MLRAGIYCNEDEVAAMSTVFNEYSKFISGMVSKNAALLAQCDTSDTTVSLSVVIGLCKRKETAALKIKATVSMVRENMSTVRRLFFFAVVRQIKHRKYY